MSKTLLLNDIPDEIENILEQRLQFLNPKWLDNEKMGRWNRGTTKTLKFYKKRKNGGLIIPRGYMRQLLLLCKNKGIGYKLKDNRRQLTEVQMDFIGELKDFQQKAVDIILPKEFGTLSSPTGSGKTVMCLYVIAKRKQPALIVVHTKDLAFQWIDRIHQFLGIPKDAVGLIGAGKHVIGDAVTVALVQSLYKCKKEVSTKIGHLVVDECHRTPSRTFTEAVSAFDARYMLGLSATPWRRDRLSKLIFFHLGDLHHEVDRQALEKNGHILKTDVIFRNTDFNPYFDPVNEYVKMLSELTSDDDRNHLIASDVAKASESRTGVCLVLSDRKKHCASLQSILRYKFKVHGTLLTGDLTTEQRKDVLERLNKGEVKVLIATGQLIGEGFDCKNLSTLFLATPIRFSGRVLQYMGRILRPSEDKEKALVYDYVDVKVAPLVAGANARKRVYETM